MKRIVLLLALIPSAAYADKTYNAEKSVSHDCAKDGVATVNVADAKFTFTGSCKQITLNGAGLTVTIENVEKLGVNGSGSTIDVVGADKITVNGRDNKITYKSNVAGKGKPKVTTNGAGNKVAQKK